jgi:hypothetical protein
MADQPMQRNVPRPAESVPVSRPMAPAPMSDPDVVSRPIAENTEHTIEQELAESDTPVVVYCECTNARCSGHFRRSFCTGMAEKGLVRSNRPDDPMMVLCTICYDLTLAADADLWSDVEGAMDKYHAANVELDPAEESRRASRLMEATRAAREEGAPATAPSLSAESLKAEQEPKRDTTVPVVNDASQTTSYIPTLEPEEKK